MVIPQTTDNGKGTSANVISKYWESADGTKKRYYITLVFSDRSRCDIGYIDCETKKVVPAAKGYVAGWANNFQYDFDAANN